MKIVGRLPSPEDIEAAKALIGPEPDPVIDPGSVVTMTQLKASMMRLKDVFAREGRPAPTSVIIHPNDYKRLIEGNFNA